MSEAIRVVLMLLVGAGWCTLDDTTVSTVVSVLAGMISIVMTWWTRRKTTPIVQPKTPDGIPLVPAPEKPSASHRPRSRRGLAG